MWRVSVGSTGRQAVTGEFVGIGMPAAAAGSHAWARAHVKGSPAGDSPDDRRVSVVAADIHSPDRRVGRDCTCLRLAYGRLCVIGGFLGSEIASSDGRGCCERAELHEEALRGCHLLHDDHVASGRRGATRLTGCLLLVEVSARFGQSGTAPRLSHFGEA